MKKLCYNAFLELEEVLEDEMLKRWEEHKISYRIEEMLYDVHNIIKEWKGLDEDTIFWLR